MDVWPHARSACTHNKTKGLEILYQGLHLFLVRIMKTCSSSSQTTVSEITVFLELTKLFVFKKQKKGRVKMEEMCIFAEF